MRSVRERFPFQSAVRNLPDSPGAIYVACLEQQVGQVGETLTKLTASAFIRSLPTNIVERVYAGTPTLALGAVVGRDGTIYDPAPSKEIFENCWPADLFYEPQLHIEHPYWFEEGVLYLRDEVKEVEVWQGQEQETVRLTPRPVWNLLDEVGLLVGLSRLPGETNVDYKRRLETLPLLSSGTGSRLPLAIARALGLIQETLWLDRGADLVLSSRYLLPDTILVAGQLWPASQIRTDAYGRIVLPGDPQQAGQQARVVYAWGVHPISLQSVFSSETHMVDIVSQDALELYTKELRSRAPILWGEFTYNEAYYADPDAQPVSVRPLRWS